MKTNTLTILIFLLISGLIYLNILITPEITYEVIDGEKMVVMVDGKEVFRPLTETDYLEGNVNEQ